MQFSDKIDRQRTDIALTKGSIKARTLVANVVNLGNSIPLPFKKKNQGNNQAK